MEHRGCSDFEHVRFCHPLFALLALFSVSADRVGRRSADPRAAPHSLPDSPTTCRRNAEKRCRRNVQTKRRKTLPPKRLPADSAIRRIGGKTFRLYVESAGRRFGGKTFFEGKQGDGAAVHTDIRAAEKKIKITFIKFFNNRLGGSPPHRTASTPNRLHTEPPPHRTACPFGWGLLRIDGPASRLYKYRYALFTGLQTKRRKIP